MAAAVSLAVEMWSAVGDGISAGKPAGEAAALQVQAEVLTEVLIQLRARPGWRRRKQTSGFTAANPTRANRTSLLPQE